jgi:hypothetical protein
MSTTAQETRRRALLECERRFCDNRTEVLNGSAVVKSAHELVCMGLDLRLCSMTHLLKAEAELAKHEVVEAYVVYGLNVFEYEYAEKERIRQNQAHETQVEQAVGGSRKKCRTQEASQPMTLGVSSGVNTDEGYGLSDDDEGQLLVEEEGDVGEDLAEAKVARAAELRTEALAAFKEYRNFNRIDLCAKGGWAQYLPGALGGGLPVPVLPRAPAAVDVSAGERVALPSASFFAPRGVRGGAGGVAAELPTSAVTSNGPAPAQYDVIADLLHANMFKVYSDMLRSESLRLKKGLSAKFGYLPMMAVAALGALNAESFCERVLSCVKLVVSDLHVSLKAEEIRMLVMLRMNREFMEYMRKTYPDTPLSEFKAADTYVRTRGGLETLDDDEDDD